MKTQKIIFLWLFVLFTTTAMGETLTVSSPGYSKQATSGAPGVTPVVINVRPGTTLTLVASGSGATYWTADQALTSPTFPISSPASNTVTLIMPATYASITITVYFGSPSNLAIFVLTRNIDVAAGLISTQQNVQGCSGVGFSFPATNPFQTGFVYTWLEYNGTTWVGLGSNSYYSATGHVLNVQANSSILSKRFKCVVSNPDCFGAIDETAEVVVQSVYVLPTATFSAGSGICPGQNVNLIVTPAAGVGPYSVTMNNGTGDLVAPNNINPVNVITGGSATFSVVPSTTVTYHFTVRDSNMCSVTF